jgi:hypothetical protein
VKQKGRKRNFAPPGLQCGFHELEMRDILLDERHAKRRKGRVGGA